MCLFTPKLLNLDRFNWDGDHIVFDALVPSSRLPIGRTRGRGYDIDVREFLVSENNAVTKRALAQDLPRHFSQQAGLDLSAMGRRQAGDFDMRAHLIAAYVAATIRYKPTDGHDPWQFPDETLSLKSGDCEDIAFLLASLLLASGISGYNVRVALGRIVLHGAQGGTQRFDHMWVMYKCEAGHWLVLEPLRLDGHRPKAAMPAGRVRRPATGAAAAAIAYQPAFVFNRDHLWQVDGPGDKAAFQQIIRRKWTRFHPRFAGQVHHTILHSALDGLAPQPVLDGLDRHFGRIAGMGPVIDDIDNLFTHGYDSRDHFDNGFIPEGWAQVQARLASFAANNARLDDFAYAAHGLADFYAHSSYLHFAQVTEGRAQPYDPAQPDAGLAQPIRYDAASQFDLAAGPFSLNPHVYAGTALEAAQYWQGQIISGRYAQKGDTQGSGPTSLIEALTFIPQALRRTPGFAMRGGLPHHNEIAVDDDARESSHRLYHDAANPAPDDRLAYRNQFAWRRDTAIAHIRQAFQACWQVHGD